MKPKADLSILWHTCEVVSSRVDDADLLKDIVPCRNMKCIACAIEWSHAHANIKKPLKIMERHSGLPDNYW